MGYKESGYLLPGMRFSSSMRVSPLHVCHGSGRLTGYVDELHFTMYVGIIRQHRDLMSSLMI